MTHQIARYYKRMSDVFFMRLAIFVAFGILAKKKK